MSYCVVLGAGGFIGAHMVKRLKRDGHWVRGVDMYQPPYAPTHADEFLLGDLTKPTMVRDALTPPPGASHIARVYQFATVMGGAGYIFIGDHDARVMTVGTQINSRVAEVASQTGVERLFFPSSACVYNQHAQQQADAAPLTEDLAYPAFPDSEYGWEKLFSERLYLAYARTTALAVTIARFHAIVGPEGTWTGGREKVFAALCRKIAEAPDGGTITIWGDGEQTRTFLDVEECLEGIERLMAAGASGPVNLGSHVLISINALIQRIAAFAGKTIQVQHTDGPLGVRGRASDHTLLRALTGWAPTGDLDAVIARTYPWVAQQVAEARRAS